MLSAALLFLKSRAGEYAIILVLVLGIGAYGYHHITETAKTEQMAADQKVVDKCNADKKTAVDSLAYYVRQYTQLVANTKKAVADQAVAQGKIDAASAAKLADAETRAAHIRTVIKQVDHYVSHTADYRCVIPVGFVQLFNGSLEAHTGAGFPGLSDSASAVNDTPSGIKLSDLAAVDAANHAEAVQRGVIIKGWQDWYTASKANFDKAKADANALQPVQSIAK